MVVNTEIAFHGQVQLLGRSEASGFQNLADTTIKAFHHSVRLWMSGLDQAMINTMQFALFIK